MSAEVMKRIMERAWAIRRAAAAEAGVPVGAVLMGECLKMAWVQVGGPRRVAAGIRSAWAAMSEKEQGATVCKACRVALKRMLGETLGSSYKAEWLEGMAFGRIALGAADGEIVPDGSELVAETWERWLKKLAGDRLETAFEKRAADGKKLLSLFSLLCQCVRAAASHLYTRDHKHYSGRAYEATDDEGASVEVMELVGDGGRTVADIETNASLAAFMAELDAPGVEIMQGLIEGKTEREIAQRVPFSNVAVHKRITKYRAMLAEFMQG